MLGQDVYYDKFLISLFGDPEDESHVSTLCSCADGEATLQFDKKNMTYVAEGACDRTNLCFSLIKEKHIVTGAKAAQ